MTVKLNLEPLRRFGRAIQAGLDGKAGPIHRAVRQWALTYLSFAQKRFDRFSRGGGNWPPLKATTKRRKARKGRSLSILRDRNLLFEALTPTFTRKPGGLQQDIPSGVRAGYGGSARYPGSKMSIADIANAHQTGRGNLPVRKIIVDPDSPTQAAMGRDMEKGLGELARITGVH